MAGVKLNILKPKLSRQRYSCHGCGNCCRDFTVQLRDDDLARLQEQGWAEEWGEPVTVDFRGATYLRQREDGACIFWMDDGRCRIHAKYGFEKKPIACQMFPFSLVPAERGAVMGISFACQSVLENKGAELATHLRELGRMAKSLPEVRPATRPPLLTDKLQSSVREVRALSDRLNAWMRKDDLPLATRLDGLAWLVGSLDAAKLDGVREGRFADLLDALFKALPEELDYHPLVPAATRQCRLLRQAAFARTEDPKLGRIEKQGMFRTRLQQLARSRRFMKGRGVAPAVGERWPEGVDLARVESIHAASGEDDIKQIDDLLRRYLQATILGGAAWGPGYYGWPIVRGLQAMVLNVAVVGWLARLHAAGHGRDAISIQDVRAALGRVDRTSGRARWLGTAGEKLRLSYLQRDDGLRRLLMRYGLVDVQEVD